MLRSAVEEETSKASSQPPYNKIRTIDAHRAPRSWHSVLLTTPPPSLHCLPPSVCRCLHHRPCRTVRGRPPRLAVCRSRARWSRPPRPRAGQYHRHDKAERRRRSVDLVRVGDCVAGRGSYRLSLPGHSCHAFPFAYLPCPGRCVPRAAAGPAAGPRALRRRRRAAGPPGRAGPPSDRKVSDGRALLPPVRLQPHS